MESKRSVLHLNSANRGRRRNIEYSIKRREEIAKQAEVVLREDPHLSLKKLAQVLKCSAHIVSPFYKRIRDKMYQEMYPPEVSQG